jgi:hypothetical protein
MPILRDKTIKSALTSYKKPKLELIKEIAAENLRILDKVKT